MLNGFFLLSKPSPTLFLTDNIKMNTVLQIRKSNFVGHLCIALDWLKIGLNDNIVFYFVLFNCSWKKRQKAFPCLHKSKREAIWRWKACFRKVFKVTEIEMFEPIFHKHLNSSNKKTSTVKSFSGFSKFLGF